MICVALYMVLNIPIKTIVCSGFFISRRLSSIANYTHILSYNSVSMVQGYYIPTHN